MTEAIDEDDIFFDTVILIHEWPMQPVRYSGFDSRHHSFKLNEPLNKVKSLEHYTATSDTTLQYYKIH